MFNTTNASLLPAPSRIDETRLSFSDTAVGTEIVIRTIGRSTYRFSVRRVQNFGRTALLFGVLSGGRCPLPPRSACLLGALGERGLEPGVLEPGTRAVFLLDPVSSGVAVADRLTTSPVRAVDVTSRTAA